LLNATAFLPILYHYHGVMVVLAWHEL
jgi:hypothetical protein